MVMFHAKCFLSLICHHYRHHRRRCCFCILPAKTLRMGSSPKRGVIKTSTEGVGRLVLILVNIINDHCSNFRL